MVLTDAQWAVLSPLIEQCRPRAKVPPQHLRRTISAIIWRHDNGAKWRALPADLGPLRSCLRGSCPYRDG
jgi:transposase